MRAGAFEPRPRLNLAAEGVDALRWWTLDEIEASDATFSPRRLPRLLRELLEVGPPPEPIDVGV